MKQAMEQSEMIFPNVPQQVLDLHLKLYVRI